MTDDGPTTSEAGRRPEETSPAEGNPASVSDAVAGPGTEAMETVLRAAERLVPGIRDRPVAPKEYYSISEVCELVGLRPHVLRYWETQFGVLNPSKNRSGNRVYQRKEIKLILLVKHLLYEEKYTVEGAKARIDQLRRGGDLAGSTAHALDQEMLSVLQTELRELREILSPHDPG